jgi:hypothetical protein
MTTPCYIYAYCHSKNNTIVHNNTPIFTSDNDIDFLKNLYHTLHINYPKFFKMDNLCKLAFLTAEVLLQKKPAELNPANTSVLISNASSTIHTDLKHQNSIQVEGNYFPSPAVFVYTLPNILIGEICIRHAITGENTFFITKNFDSKLLSEYTQILFKNPINQLTIMGWAEYTETKYDCFFALISNKPGGLNLEFTPENIGRLYHSIS